MKVDLTRVIKQLEGQPFKHPKTDAEGKTESFDLTSKDVILVGLLNASGGQDETGDQKFKRYEIAMRVKAANDSCELSHEEIILIKKLINAHGYMPLVYGQMSECLEKPAAEAAA